MRLKREPAEPRATAIYLYGTYLKQNGEWEPYLRGW
jgi:hypothetical protein